MLSCCEKAHDEPVGHETYNTDKEGSVDHCEGNIQPQIIVLIVLILVLGEIDLKQNLSNLCCKESRVVRRPHALAAKKWRGYA